MRIPLKKDAGIGRQNCCAFPVKAKAKQGPPVWSQAEMKHMAYDGRVKSLGIPKWAGLAMVSYCLLGGCVALRHFLICILSPCHFGGVSCTCWVTAQQHETREHKFVQCRWDLMVGRGKPSCWIAQYPPKKIDFDPTATSLQRILYARMDKVLWHVVQLWILPPCRHSFFTHCMPSQNWWKIFRNPIYFLGKTYGFHEANDTPWHSLFLLPIS